MDIVKKAKDIVRQYVIKGAFYNAEESSDINVFVVWQCKTLQNWKFMLITDLPDNTYYELTYNGDEEEFYLDVYDKKDNVVIKNHDLKNK